MSNKVFWVARQRDLMDCGPTCLQMIARHYGRCLRLERLRERFAKKETIARYFLLDYFGFY